MSNTSTGFTSTELIASAAQALIGGGYRQITDLFKEWDTPTSRLFEDPYTVVGVVVFNTCGELLRAWPDLQGSLVDVISRHVGKAEAKSWDGYLVLLTAGLAPSEAAEIEAVRYNTTRLRKLVATGDDFQGATDLQRVLSPLLPLIQDGAKLSQESALDLLPGLLAQQGIPMETTQLLLDAFREQAPMLERLHAQKGQR
jgi:hypothetical protein